MGVHAKILDFFLPPRCTACGTKVSDHGALCAKCWSDLHHITAPQCNCCGLPFDFDVGEGALCGACIKETPSFDWARAPLHYSDISQSVVTSLKHGKRLENAALIAHMMHQAAGKKLSDIDYLIPIPLHRKRLFKRRFNQAAYIAQQMEKLSVIPVALYALEWKKETKPQVGLTRAERQKNVRGAFAVSDTSIIAGKRIILIDDVLTTGATVEAAAKAL